MRARFDQFTKGIFRDALTPAGTVTRIKSADAAELSRWAKRVLSAPTLEEVLRDP
jgi:hypothetical protein